MSAHMWVRRRRPTRLILILAVLGLAAIALYQCVPNRHSVEGTLTERSQSALRAHGISGVSVNFSGRDGELVVANANDVQRAAEVVRHVEGVRVVTARPGPGATIPRPPAIMIVLAASGHCTLTGSVASDSVRAALVRALRDGTASRAIQDNLTVDPAVGDAAISGLPVIVAALGPADATITLRDGRITLTGSVNSSAASDAATKAAAGAVGEDNVSNRLLLSRKAIQIALSALPRITFESGSADLTAAGRVAIVAAAGILKGSPGTHVRVEGHTDSTGASADNVVLSRARAETVVATLVSLGVPPGQLSSIGYGESRPRVPDTTPTNQAINRRVEIQVLG